LQLQIAQRGLQMLKVSVLSFLVAACLGFLTVSSCRLAGSWCIQRAPSTPSKVRTALLRHSIADLLFSLAWPDEAVVAEILRDAQGEDVLLRLRVLRPVIVRCRPGTVELVDVSKRLPGLKRCPGLTTWKVMDKVIEHRPFSLSPAMSLHRCFLQGSDWYDSIKDVPEARFVCCLSFHLACLRSL
jgi:hypothetical protein